MPTMLSDCGWLTITSTVPSLPAYGPFCDGLFTVTVTPWTESTNPTLAAMARASITGCEGSPAVSAVAPLSAAASAADCI
jgi:hypothetical protein